jgi:hypothetical protein
MSKGGYISFVPAILFLLAVQETNKTRESIPIIIFFIVVAKYLIS